MRKSLNTAQSKYRRIESATSHLGRFIFLSLRAPVPPRKSLVPLLICCGRRYYDRTDTVLFSRAANEPENDFVLHNYCCPMQVKRLLFLGLDVLRIINEFFWFIIVIDTPVLITKRGELALQNVYSVNSRNHVFAKLLHKLENGLPQVNCFHRRNDLGNVRKPYWTSRGRSNPVFVRTIFFTNLPISL